MKEVSESQEDYLEAIYQICEQSQVARVKEIAKRMEVSTASVVGALRVLRERGLAEQERYGYVRLTQMGCELAKNVSDRHQALAEFFQKVLGVSPTQAEQDACKAEHTLAPEIIRRLILLKEFMTTQSRTKGGYLAKFQKFLKEKE